MATTRSMPCQRASSVLDVRFELLPDAAREWKPDTRVRFHLGASELIGRLILLGEASQKAIDWIKGIVAEPEVGVIYTGKVVKTMDFGAFVNFMGSKDGLVHISELAPHRVNQTTDIVKVGDTVKVKLLGFDDRGKVKLSMKRVDQQTGADISDQFERAGFEVPVLSDQSYARLSEFFAVASETFFESPVAFRREYPELYEQFRLFYRQDPAARDDNG